ASFSWVLPASSFTHSTTCAINLSASTRAAWQPSPSIPPTPATAKTALRRSSTTLLTLSAGFPASPPLQPPATPNSWAITRCTAIPSSATPSPNTKTTPSNLPTSLLATSPLCANPFLLAANSTQLTRKAPLGSQLSTWP